MIKWRQTCVGRHQTIRETLQVINQSALQVALVVDQDFVLQGIVTDGDIRRALLNYVDMQRPIEEIMTVKPITAKTSTSKAQLIDLMEKYVLLSIPLVTDDNKVCDLISLHQLVSAKPAISNAVLLMAGGFGKRLSPLTNNCPKPLLRVGELPILERILKDIVACGFTRVYISTHYMPEKITEYFGDGSRWGANISYIHENNPLGTAGALGLLPLEEIEQDLLVMNGDILTNVNFAKLIEFHQDNSADATMCVREYVNQIPYGVIETRDGKIVNIQEKPSYQHFVNAGIYVISPKLIRNITGGQHIDMTSLLEQCIANQGEVVVYPILDYWMDIGKLDDFRQAQIDVKAL